MAFLKHIRAIREERDGHVIEPPKPSFAAEQNQGPSSPTESDPVGEEEDEPEGQSMRPRL